MMTDEHLPMCMVVLDAETLYPVQVNDLFEASMGPLYKFKDTDFVLAAAEEDSTAKEDQKEEGDQDTSSRHRLRQALRQAAAVDPHVAAPDATIRVRNIEMTTVAGPSGFPVRRFYDWFIRPTKDETPRLMLLGDPCTEQDVANRERDAELIDFFQNAPIALHWLSGEGKVIWANQTELNVLGYTAEEYIGQEIMKFCPDEKELVLEIFKQLGSGNSIRDVPVRFRTKDGKIVHLLIDSNVRYNKDGSFGHTRCFIRDDTGRKIRQERASLLLEETKRSLAMLDNFLARSLHHLRTPLHVTQNMVDAVASYFQTHNVFSDDETKECVEMVLLANEQIKMSVAFLDDLGDLARFDQGSVLHITPQVVDLESFGRDVLNSTSFPCTKRGVKAVLGIRQNELNGEGPSMAVTDPTVLKRILKHLLNNAVEATEHGTVSLLLGYQNKRLTIAVEDTGVGLEMSEGAAEGDLPLIFQRYHQELLPEDTQDLVVSTSLREKIEKGINTHKKTGMGIGLSLTYHLTQALGGELRCTSTPGKGTKFQFSLPRTVSYNSTIASCGPLTAARAARAAPEKPSLSHESMLFSITTESTEKEDSNSGTLNSSDSANAPFIRKKFDKDIPREITATSASSLVSEGVKSQDPPSVLVVEDTQACAKLLCRILSRLKCATKWAENGQIAVDLIKEATPGTFDLILMDLRMPVMDGLEATRILKSELGISTPVVALTGDDNEQTREEAKEMGFADFYGKPMKRNDLKKILQEHTGFTAE